MTPFHIIIPARYQSSRLPGKALVTIGDKPMIQHVVECCKRSDAISVVVATDDNRIVEAVAGFGGQSVLTSSDHESGSDRIAEACEILNFDDDTIVVNVQGDEPDMPAALINQLADALFSESKAMSATASAPLDDIQQLQDPSIVKVVTDKYDYAVYFSRATIPWVRSENDSGLAADAWEIVRRHLGIYAYRVAYLKKFSALSSCDLEYREKLEQLRSIWHGDKILVVEAVETPGPGIDTEEDLEIARKRYNK